MPRIIILYLCGMIFSSCVSIFNKPYQNVIITGEKPLSIFYNHDTIHSNENNSIQLNIYRNKQPLFFDIFNDSIRKQIELSSKISKSYYANIISPYFLGFIIDKNNSNKYTYETPIFFDEELELKGLTRQQKREINAKTEIPRFKHYELSYPLYPQKNDLYVSMTFPFVYPSLTNTKPNNEKRKRHAPFIGMSLGLDYYHQDNKFINISGSMIGAGYSFGMEVYEEGEQKVINLYNINISHNHKYDFISFGYGLSYTFNHWQKNQYEFRESYNDAKYCFPELTSRNSSKTYSTLGVVLNCYIYLTPTFAAGIVYKPNFVRLNSNGGNRFVYEHTISFDFAFKLRTYRKRK